MSDQTNLLEAAITRTSSMLTAEPAERRGGWAFTRCWLQLTRFELSGNDPAALRAALDDFDAIPTGMPGRPKLAAALVNCQIRAGRLREGPAIRRAAALAEVADSDPEPLPAWPTNRAVVRALTLMKACQEGDASISVRSALKELDELDAVVDGVKPQADILEFARIGLAQLHSEQDMDHGGLEESRRRAEDMARRHGPGSPLHGRTWIATTLMEAQAATARGDLAAVANVVEKIRAGTAALPPQDPMRPQLEQMLASLAPYLDLVRKGAQHPGGFVSPSFNPVPEDGALAELR
ncbi:MAG TPA: hypothetical protein VK659_27230, partial [Asanoa sp.]|nr:hypothetical protein [Asanoa sp.]